LVPTNKPTGLFQPSPNKTAKPQGFDEGDETLGTDPAYIAAMNKVPETTTYTSPFGYTINLMKGWRKIDKLSFDDVNGKSEAFSPYTDDQIENMLTTDPYNPNYYLEVEVRENPQNISLSEWTTNSKHAPQAVGQESYDTVVGGIPAKKILGNQGTGYYDYYISANGKIYNLGYFYTTEKQWKSPPEMSIDIFQTMIESFIPTK